MDEHNNSLITEIVKSNNIVDVIGSYINLERKGKNYFGVCPFHADNHPSMSVSDEKQIFKCFSCGASGNVLTFLEDYLGITFKEAIQILADNAGIKLSNNFTKKKENKYSDLFKINELAKDIYKNNLYSEKGKDAREYLLSRKIDDDIIKNFEIGLALDNSLYDILKNKYDGYQLNSIDLCKEYNGRYIDTFTNRIVFPIKDIDGNTIGFTGRIYRKDDKSESKYLNTRETEIFKKGLIFYNLDQAKEYIRKSREIIISEGQMDTIRLYSSGYKNSVSLSGTSLTKEQIEIITKLKCNIVLNLDQDEAGAIATSKIGDVFEKLGINVKVVVFDKAKDTDELISKYGKEYFDEAYKNKIDFVTFKMNYLKRGKNLKDSLEISKYINEVIEELNKVGDDVLVNLKIKELSREYGIDESVLKSKINKKEEIKIQKNESKQNKKYSRYEKAEMRLINLMLENDDVIRIYQNNLGYLVTENMTLLASEIVNFKKKNKIFDLSDFITYTYQIEGLNAILKEVLSNNISEEYTEEEVYGIINDIKLNSVNNLLDKLNKELKDTLDVTTKKEIIKKIENIKKDILSW